VSVSNQAVIVVGLPENEVLMDCNDYSDFGLEEVPYYYDCNERDRIVGIVVKSSGSSSWNEIDVRSLTNLVEDAILSFNEITGLDAKVYLSNCSY